MYNSSGRPSHLSRIGGVAPQRRQLGSSNRVSNSTHSVGQNNHASSSGTTPEEHAIEDFRRNTKLSSAADDVVDAWLSSYSASAEVSEQMERRHLIDDPELFKPRPQRLGLGANYVAHTQAALINNPLTRALLGTPSNPKHTREQLEKRRRDADSDDDTEWTGISRRDPARQRSRSQMVFSKQTHTRTLHTEAQHSVARGESLKQTPTPKGKQNVERKATSSRSSGTVSALPAHLLNHPALQHAQKKASKRKRHRSNKKNKEDHQSGTSPS